MSARPCPSFEVLSRAFSEQRGATMERHLGVCPRCAAAWRDLEVMHGAAAALPVPALSDGAAARIEEALVAATLSPAPKRRTFAPWVVAWVSVLAVVVWWSPWRSPAPPAVVVTPVAEADYERSVRYDGERPVREVVRVRRGRLRLEATGEVPLEVVTADARLEGTSFEVVVVEDRLVDVVVRAGSVAVQGARAPDRILRVGDRWGEDLSPEVAAEPTTPTAPPSASRPEVARRSAVPPAPSPNPRPADDVIEGVGGPRGVGFAPPDAPSPPRPSEAELAFERGWAALRVEDFTLAERAFDEVVRVAPQSPLAEDAAYWRAVALVRANRDEAREALRSFVAIHPDGPRAPEVWVLLGWRELAASNVTAARDAFTRGASTGGPLVRAEARRGLAAMGGAP